MNRRARVLRWGWLAITLALAIGLPVTAWIARIRVAAAVTTLNRGQGDVLLQALRQGFRAMSAVPDSAGLAAVQQQYATSGLRYLAILDTSRRLMVEAGTSLIGSPVGGRPERPWDDYGTRVRQSAPAFIGPMGQPGGGPPQVRPPLLVFEFEPVVASGLLADATRTFTIAAVVAVLFLSISLAVWRLLIHQELIEQRLEQQQRLGMLGEMSAVLAHEIRNPLASLKGHAQLLAERLPAGVADRGKADRIVQEASRLEALTGDLLQFARSGPIDLQPADPAALGREAADEVDLEGFDLHVTEAPSTWWLDGRRMRQALVNLLRNARQASPGTPRPTLRVAHEGGRLVFEVRDFGAGIPSGDEKRIFEPFYTTRTSGTGLGLAVASRIAELHGGNVSAANHPDGGAIFRISVPRR